MQNFNSSTVSTSGPELLPRAKLKTELLRRQDLQAVGGLALDIEAFKRRCERFVGFVKEDWHILEPNNRYLHNWHADAIGDHLEAVTYGKINPRLLINVPPGTSKGLLTSVFWPAWEWGPAGLASLRYLSTSYSDKDAPQPRAAVNLFPSCDERQSALASTAARLCQRRWAAHPTRRRIERL